jgi:hypothetical protein
MFNIIDNYIFIPASGCVGTQKQAITLYYIFEWVIAICFSSFFFGRNTAHAFACKWNLKFRVIVLLCLMPFSTIFQLYRGGQNILVVKTGVPVENHRPVASHWQTLSNNTITLNFKFHLHAKAWAVFRPKKKEEKRHSLLETAM